MILEMKSISKSFMGTKALDHVDFDLKKGEVHALVGENGAGKSTLMNILAGVYSPSTGETKVNGKTVKISSPAVSQQLGIAIIHQELNLIPYLSVAENVFLGREPKKIGGFVHFKRMNQETADLLERFGLELDPNALVHTLSIGEQQIVEIAKAVSMNAEILIMDEPSAVLTDRETEKLFKVIQELKDQDVSIIYISHRLKELKLFCDRLTVLRDGKHVTTNSMEGLEENEIANLMVGRELQNLFPATPGNIGDEILKVEHLSCPPHFSDISFSLKKGEILGFAGLIGAGRSELAGAIFGDLNAKKGKVLFKGNEVKYRSPKQAVAQGLGFATEDRKQTGLVPEMSVAQNMILPSLKKISRGGTVSRKKEKQLADEKVEELNIKLKDIHQPVKSLSGGNQQKVVLAKWLVAETELFIFDEPTRGIDIGAKSEIYSLINELAKNGKGVIVISSELPELLGLCNRILVMNKGEITGEFDHNEATEEAIMAKATGL